MSNRRSFLIAATTTGLLAASAAEVPFVPAPSSLPALRGKMDFSPPTVRNDKVDNLKNYIQYFPEHHSRSPQTDQYLKQYVFSLDLPFGKVAELGVYRCESFDQLCTVYGYERCIGFDIHAFSPRGNVIIGDVRDFTPYDHATPLAFGWNDLSTWKNSYFSRLSGAEYINRNLVLGGYMVDSHLNHLPRTIEFKGFEKVAEFGESMLLKKISLDAKIITHSV